MQTILAKAKAAADAYARDIGGAWVVIGNPDQDHASPRDLCVAEAAPHPFWMFLPGDAILYRAEAV